MPKRDVSPDPSSVVPEGPVTKSLAGAIPGRVPTWHASRTRNSTTLPVLEPGQAVGYARFSTPGQREESVERQEDGIRRLAKANGLRLLKMYVDREVSGARSDREDLSAMLGFLRNAPNRPATVIVESADRLARDVKLFIMLWDELQKLGVALHDVRNGLVDSALKAALLGAMSHEERQAILFRTQRGREAHATEGLVMSGVAFGYRTVPGQPGGRTICASNRVHVRRMFEMRAAGASLRQICRELQNSGARLNAKQVIWHAATVKEILSNPIYCGIYTYGRRKAFRNELGRVVTRKRSPDEIIQVPVDHLRIVDVDVWEKVQMLWQDDDAGEGKPYVATTRGKYLLQGKAVCHICGQSMRLVTVAEGDPARRWRCASWVAGQSCGDPHSYDLTVVERHVFVALAGILDRDDLERSLLGPAAASIAGHNARIQAQLEDVRSGIKVAEARLQRSFDEGFSVGFSPDRAAMLRVGLEARCTELEEQQSMLLGSLKAPPSNLSHLLRLRAALVGLAEQVPFVPTDAAGLALKDALRNVIQQVTVKSGAIRDTMVIDVEFRFLPEGVSGENGTVHVTRTHHLRRSEKAKMELRQEVSAVIEARTYAISEERWWKLTNHLPAFMAVRRHDEELSRRLLVEALVVAARTGADKSSVYRQMRKKWLVELPTFGWQVQKLGGLEQLEEASRDGHLPEAGPLDLSKFKYYPRPNRSKSKRGAGR